VRVWRRRGCANSHSCLPRGWQPRGLRRWSRLGWAAGRAVVYRPPPLFTTDRVPPTSPGSARMAAVDHALAAASFAGHVAEIQRLLADGANPNCLHASGHLSPLQSASHTGQLAAVNALLHAGAIPDGVDHVGRTALMRAAGKGHTAVVTALLDAGADAHRADVFGETALHCAAGFGHTATVTVLLSAGARSDIRRTDGKTPVSVVSGFRCPWAGPSAPPRVRVVLCRCGPRA
jgi:hypothetical protein